MALIHLLGGGRIYHNLEGDNSHTQFEMFKDVDLGLAGIAEDVGNDHMAFPCPVSAAGEAERDSAGLFPRCRSGCHVSSDLCAGEA